jgi:hypothetical protein
MTSKLASTGVALRSARWNRFCTQTMVVPCAACRSCSRVTLLRPTPAIRASSRARTGGQLIIEGRVDPAVAGQTKVDRDQLADPQAAEIVFHALAQLVWIVVRDDGARVVPADRDLADEPCRTAGTFSAGLRSRWEDRLRD